MTRDEIIAAAKKAGFDEFFCRDLILEAFATLIRNQTSEEAAVMCETRLGPTATNFYGNTYAAAIRDMKT